MRKIMFAVFVAFLGFGSSAYAQFQTGQVAVGGMLNFSHTKAKGASEGTSSYKFRIQGGNFISETLEVGIGIGYSPDLEFDWGYRRREKVYTFNPYLTTYFPMGDAFALSLQNGIFYETGKAIDHYGWNGSRQSTFSSLAVGTVPGITFMPSPRFSIDLQAGFIGYHTSKMEHEGTNNDSVVNSFIFNLDLSRVNIGGRFFF